MIAGVYDVGDIRLVGMRDCMSSVQVTERFSTDSCYLRFSLFVL